MSIYEEIFAKLVQNRVMTLNGLGEANHIRLTDDNAICLLALLKTHEKGMRYEAIEVREDVRDAAIDFMRDAVMSHLENKNMGVGPKNDSGCVSPKSVNPEDSPATGTGPAPSNEGSET